MGTCAQRNYKIKQEEEKAAGATSRLKPLGLPLWQVQENCKLCCAKHVQQAHKTFSYIFHVRPRSCMSTRNNAARSQPFPSPNARITSRNIANCIKLPTASAHDHDEGSYHPRSAGSLPTIHQVLQLASLLLRDAVVLQVLGSGARTIRTAFWIDNTRNVAT